MQEVDIGCSRLWKCEDAVADEMDFLPGITSLFILAWLTEAHLEDLHLAPDYRQA